MFDRMSMWLGTALVTAGVSASLLVGAGAAVAATEPAGGGKTSTSAASRLIRRTRRDTAGPKARADADSDTPDDSDETGEPTSRRRTRRPHVTPSTRRAPRNAAWPRGPRADTTHFPTTALTTPHDTEQTTEAEPVVDELVATPQRNPPRNRDSRGRRRRPRVHRRGPWRGR